MTFPLQNDASEQSENVIENGTAVPESRGPRPGQTRSATDRLGHDHLDADNALETGTDRILSTVWLQ